MADSLNEQCAPAQPNISNKSPRIEQNLRSQRKGKIQVSQRFQHRLIYKTASFFIDQILTSMQALLRGRGKAARVLAKEVDMTPVLRSSSRRQRRSMSLHSLHKKRWRHKTKHGQNVNKRHKCQEKRSVGSKDLAVLLQATCYLNNYNQITVKSIKFYTV